MSPQFTGTKACPAGRGWLKPLRFRKTTTLMTDEFTNRLGASDTTLANLNKPANKAVWFQQPPFVFTAKVAAAAAAVEDLRGFCRKQRTAITGAALHKGR